ncbi:Tubby-like F-box protein [Actinidia chinensis var. chinensis]|uniref:Tubby-like F-box protein n=1 Tax=Actinidia chinensis var. chinensis TaxID=1590841 RepID=A0A2R6RMS5_ACTCC|nr:Tubby-like F-box protein [Actinidia chinensis var. chinensis]
MIMPFKRVFQQLKEMRDGSKNNSRRRANRKCVNGLGRSHIAPESSPSPSALVQESRWANLPPELLLDILQRIEASQTSWPTRRDVVACAAVCRSWRETTKEVVRTPEQCRLLTFPISLKQPGPKDSPIQCFIKRERGMSVYYLYLGLSPALSGNASKLLLAAKKIRRATKTYFLMSLAADDFSQASNKYIGKLRSNFLGTKFIIYDCQSPCDQAIQSNGRSHLYSKQQLSTRVPAGNFNVATISYELNVLRTRGPRRMLCTMHSIPISAIQEGGTAPTPSTFRNYLDEPCSPLSVSKGKNLVKFGASSADEPVESVHGRRDPLILKNKAPRWHEQLQCWCLNFKGRVTVASVKNFQLVAAAEPCQNVPAAEQEKVILQFGKIGKDIFTMDYCYPLSAFQAFAICLSSFDTKPACE